MITERDAHDGDHGIKEKHAELEPVDPEVPQVNRDSGNGKERSANEENTRDPVDARKRNFVEHIGK